MSGKRFGGAHSPGGPPQGAPPPASRLSARKTRFFSWRVLGLYFAPSALLILGLEGIFTADMPRIGWAMGGWGALMLAAWLTGQGLIAEAAYNERAIAKPPAFPRKIAAAVLIALAVAMISLLGIKVGVLPAIFYGALGGGAHLLTFGLDPMKAKGGETGVSDSELDRVAEKIEQAEAVVTETVRAAEAMRERALEARIDALAYAARDILKEIEGDPRDLRRSRKFLSVHLVGLRDATVKFAAARAKGAEAELRPAYEGLLGDLEASFAKHRETLLIDDKVDLEVEIEVLRDRLKQEGAV